MARSRNKKPKYARENTPANERQPRVVDASSQSKMPVWTFGVIDFGGPWCPKIMGPELLLYVLGKLRGFEAMTWNEIEGRQSHAIEVSQITKKAQDRLIEINQDDVAELVSLRLSGKERVWGIRDGQVFKLLWWDPEHEVCLSNKKHT
jgi:hypothetical protein